MAKEDELKLRLVAVLQDLRTTGGKDPEAVWLIGSLAATLADKAKAKSWPALKQSLDAAGYDKLLADFQAQGNRLAKEGETRKAYAIQALVLSLVCSRLRSDPVLRDGEALLDGLIEGAVAIFRKTQHTN